MHRDHAHAIDSRRGGIEAGSPTTCIPRIYVGPQSDEDMSRGIHTGGCTVIADARLADAVVWLGKDVADLKEMLHRGIRWVQLPDAGVERWLAAGIARPGCVFTSARGCYGPQVAEHALALILGCLHGLGEHARARSWRPFEVPASTLRGKTVAIVGSGDIGISLLQLLRPFGCRTVAVTRAGAVVPGANTSLPATGIDEALLVADVIVLAAPSTPQTIGLLSASRLERLKDSAVIVNVGRGNLIDTAALVEALDRGSLGGVALDVTDPEPLPDGHPLWRHPQALITPHTANPPAAKHAGLVARVTENCRRFAAGEELLAVVDTDLGY